MNIPAEFNEIRPYTPEEVPQIYEELIADPAFRMFFGQNHSVTTRTYSVP